MAKKIREINYEKIAVLVACTAILISFWTSQIQMMKDLKEIGERTARLEERIKIEEKK